MILSQRAVFLAVLGWLVLGQAHDEAKDVYWSRQLNCKSYSRMPVLSEHERDVRSYAFHCQPSDNKQVVYALAVDFTQVDTIHQLDKDSYDLSCQIQFLVTPNDPAQAMDQWFLVPRQAKKSSIYRHVAMGMVVSLQYSGADGPIGKLDCHLPQLNLPDSVLDKVKQVSWAINGQDVRLRQARSEQLRKEIIARFKRLGPGTRKWTDAMHIDLEKDLRISLGATIYPNTADLWLKEKSNNETFEVDVIQNPHGELQFDFRLKKLSGDEIIMSQALTGSLAYDLAFNFFEQELGRKVSAIVDTWLKPDAKYPLSDNYHEFMQLRQSHPVKEAAALTWSGRQAARRGFKPGFIDIYPQRIEVRFERDD